MRRQFHLLEEFFFPEKFNFTFAKCVTLNLTTLEIKFSHSSALSLTEKQLIKQAKDHMCKLSISRCGAKKILEKLNLFEWMCSRTGNIGSAPQVFILEKIELE